MLLQAHGLNQYSYLILQAKYLRARASELEEIQVIVQALQQVRTAAIGAPWAGKP
jgi:hypothetical protein